MDEPPSKGKGPQGECSASLSHVEALCNLPSWELGNLCFVSGSRAICKVETSHVLVDGIFHIYKGSKLS